MADNAKIIINSKNITSNTPPSVLLCLKCDAMPEIKHDAEDPLIMSIVCQCGRGVNYNGTWDFEEIIKPLIVSRFYVKKEVEVVYKMTMKDENGKEFHAMVPMDAKETAEYYEKEAKLPKKKKKRKQ
jgi:hypothetical protein